MPTMAVFTKQLYDWFNQTTGVNKSFSVKPYAEKEFGPNTGFNRAVYQPQVKPAQRVV